MTAASDYPRLADFASRPSGRSLDLIDRRVEARAALAEIDRLRAAIDGIRWVLDGEHGTMRHTTFARLDRDECREIAELLAVYPPRESPC